MKNKLFVVGAAIAAIIIFLVVSMNTKTPAPVVPVVESLPPESQSNGAPLFVRPHSPSMGNTMARVTVIEWFDPECESCRMFHPVFKKIVAQYKDRVHFVLRYMPYHKNSMYAASVLEEAHEMGKFEQALDILFEKQPEWGDHHAPKPELIPGYLAKIGLSKNNLVPEVVIKKHGEKVKIDEDDGMRLGVQSTPTFFVNGQPLEQLGEKNLIDMIELVLEK
ncbi:MAG: thioredoxin domain-containing protein [Pseudomonadota bacterium]|nr:thioredoxin domain-containing protein [Pseudomonadota bacterium]